MYEGLDIGGCDSQCTKDVILQGAIHDNSRTKAIVASFVHVALLCHISIRQ